MADFAAQALGGSEPKVTLFPEFVMLPVTAEIGDFEPCQRSQIENGWNTLAAPTRFRGRTMAPMPTCPLAMSSD